MGDFLAFLAGLAGPLFDLYRYVREENRDPEEEKALAARLIRAAIDEQARREILP
jgi:hypothetical protein